MKNILKRLLVLLLAFIPFLTVYALDITNVQVDADGTVTWDAVEGAAVYDIGDGSTWSGITASPTENVKSYLKGELENHKEYTLKVYAYSDANGANEIARFEGVVLHKDGQFFNSDYHSITFDSNGGPEVHKRYFIGEDKTEEPEVNMTREGYVFNGWYRNIDTLDRFEFGEPLTEDITLYAYYVEGEEDPTFTVIYDLNGGHGPNGETTLETHQVGYVPFITTENFIDHMSVTPPEGKTLMGIEINGKFYEIDKGEGYELNKDTTYKYIWSGDEEEPEGKKYVLTTGDYEVEFTTGAEGDYSLEVFDILTLKKEELEALGVTEEQFNEILTTIKNNVKQYGNLLNIFAINVNNASGNNYSDGTKFKLKLTDEMKKYNSFKFIYIDDENNFKVADIVDFKIEGDYLVGTLPHLSIYALVGNVVEETNNPKTEDSINKDIIMLSLSLVGLFSSITYVKRRVVNN